MRIFRRVIEALRVLLSTLATSRRRDTVAGKVIASIWRGMSRTIWPGCASCEAHALTPTARKRLQQPRGVLTSFAFDPLTRVLYL